MKRSATLFLKIAIVIIAIGALIGMIRFPQTEGRAANLDLISIYRDPFIIYLYITSIPFFIGLHQAFRLLGLVDKNKIFSKDSVKVAGNIKYAALAFMSFMTGALLYIFIMSRTTHDDGAGAMMVGLVTIFASGVIAAAAAAFQKRLQKAVDLKSEKN